MLSDAKKMKDGESPPSSIVELKDYLSEGKFAFDGRKTESHTIGIAISGDDIVNQPYNPSLDGSAVWFIKKYRYQLFCKMADDDLVDLKNSLTDCDTIIWRSAEIENNLYRIRLAAIKNGEQIMLGRKD